MPKSIIEAACCEIREETGLFVTFSEYLFGYESQILFHQVVLAAVKGRVYLQRCELSENLSWDRKSNLELGDCARATLKRVLATSSSS